MKWYFALNHKTAKNYDDHIKAAVRSARKNTNLSPHFIYDGPEDELTRWMRDHGVAVVFHDLSFRDIVIEAYKGDEHRTNVALGAYLRADIPLIERDAYALYTDCDVIFLKNPCFDTSSCRLFSVCPESDRNDWSVHAMNTGVMLMNLGNLRNMHKYFVDFLRSWPIKNFAAFDQDAFRIVYNGLWDRLPLECNWKPYWGLNNNATIIHFHGPKYQHVRSFIEGHGGYWRYAAHYYANREAYHSYLEIFEAYMKD